MKCSCALPTRCACAHSVAWRHTEAIRGSSPVSLLGSPSQPASDPRAGRGGDLLDGACEQGRVGLAVRQVGLAIKAFRKPEVASRADPQTYPGGGNAAEDLQSQ